MHELLCFTTVAGKLRTAKSLQHFINIEK